MNATESIRSAKRGKLLLHDWLAVVTLLRARVTKESRRVTRENPGRWFNVERAKVNWRKSNAALFLLINESCLRAGCEREWRKRRGGVKLKENLRNLSEWGIRSSWRKIEYLRPLVRITRIVWKMSEIKRHETLWITGKGGVYGVN